MKQIFKELSKILLGLLVLYLSHGFAGMFDEYFQGMMWWVFCGLPYGLPKMRTWLYMRNGDIVSSVLVFILNFMLAGFIGGFVFAWSMIKSALNIVVAIFGRIREKVSTK